jgi:peptide/nickel transport system permease protein
MTTAAPARKHYQHLSQWLAWAWLIGLVLAALWSLAVVPPGAGLPVNLDQLIQPPSARHWLGTDPYGRDVLLALVVGTRNLVAVSLPAAVIATLLGGGLGAAAGYWGNQSLHMRRAAATAALLGGIGALASSPQQWWWWLLGTGLSIVAVYNSPLRASWRLPLDRLVLAVAAFTASVPRLVLALLLAALHAPSRLWLLAVLAGTCWPATARLTRTLVSQLRRQPYIEAGRTAGFSATRLLWHHVLPNAWPSLRTSLPLNLTVCFGLQTTLSFLGLGLPPDQLDWGRTLADARLEPSAWWLTAGSLLFLMATMLALHQLLPAQTRRNLSGQPADTTRQVVTNDR